MSRWSWWDLFDPFTYLGDAVAETVTGIWTMVMIALWNSGLWVLRLELTVMDAFTSPDLTPDGPARTIYPVTFWAAGVLVTVLVVIQVGVAAVRRDGRSLARAVIGTAQFGIVVVAWLGYGAAVLAACAGLTTALMTRLLGVEVWAGWQPWQGFSLEDITDGSLATVLGVMGLLLWLAGIGHLLVMMVRAVALIVLAATTPIAASGLVWEGGRVWFWKSFRWFHAAAFTPVLMVLMLGLGVQVSSTVVVPGDTDLAAAVGTAVPAILIILMSCFAPLALFKLLAFVDPGSSSGAAMRAGLAANGGIHGLLTRGGGGGDQRATATSGGRALGEAAGEEATTSRFAATTSGSSAGAGGAGAGAGTGAGGGATAGSVGVAGAAAPGVGLVVAGAAIAYGAMSRAGTQAAGLVADIGNQGGIGHDVYQPDAPDFGRPRTDPTARSTAAREATGTPPPTPAPSSTPATAGPAAAEAGLGAG